MKKIIALVLAVMMAVCCLAGCGSAKDDNTLTMATNAEFPPYEYMENNEIVGIDAEISKAIAEKLGCELVIENVDFDSLIPGVQTGKYDFAAAGMTVTDERLEQVNFTCSPRTAFLLMLPSLMRRDI